MSDNAKLEIKGNTYELPVITGTEGETAIDITTLRAKSGVITIDNGFMNTGSCKSAITFLDGEKGILRYRGYPIEQLAESSNFVETSYLLFNGELPTKAEHDAFYSKISSFSSLPSGVKNILNQFPATAHPMGVLSATISALSGFYPEYLTAEATEEIKNKSIAQLMAQVKIIMANFYRKTIGKDPVDSNPALGYSKDFLNMMFDKEIDDEVAHALDTLLILHADHEQNCSTSTVRVVGSSHANVFASISGGVDALWGQLHGGANQAVLEMLDEIKNDGGDYKKFINKAKDKDDSFRLMGFGHRVYKNFDPRAKIIKKACDVVLEKLNVQDPLLAIARGLEEEALKDEYFVQRNLYPNVDFYSGIIYKALGIPTNMFTAMFVLGRLPGWLSQWKELREDTTGKIARPRQIYVGENERNYKKISDR
ncbi:citrate synthase [Bacteriovorax sp. Seq25_V]|uniref:citrate synthase n=1 Tax=Bacteriovorax sp. Seq25_V TaxID=1201288 RepID=UPI000389F613|nr:citrate synthase [Bacteriovorax sp. Seq25_V]EQC46580.1 citrate (Si)-synthase [Bacteriovorax sp. Seq25_V]